MRLRCEVCGGTDFETSDGSCLCKGCGMLYASYAGMHYAIGGPGEPVADRCDGGGRARPAAGGNDGMGGADGSDGTDDMGESASSSPGPGAWGEDGRWQAREDGDAVGEGRVDDAWGDTTVSAYDDDDDRRPPDTLSTRTLVLIGVAVFGLCYVLSRLKLDLRVIGLSLQEWLLFSYTALLLATLARRDSKAMRVLAVSCSLLAILVLCLQVRAWEVNGSFSLLRLPGSAGAGQTQTQTQAQIQSERQVGSEVPAPAELGTFEVRRVLGEGDDVVALDCSPAPCLIDVSHAGEGDFALATCDADGKRREMLAISTGPYEGRVTTYGDARDVAALEVTADGAWELTIRPMEAIERAELDGAGGAVAFHGDGVVYVDDASVAALGLAHRGEGRLAVRAVSDAGTEVLVDATGTFEDTVAWGRPRAYLVVSADGDWSMSRA